MPAINLLSREISELIAAGEVIERPASVIKELIENSIDAGAKHITVETKRGGTTFMRITDDGCGISFEDVPKAFLRHATSKIKNKDDLEHILTLGFRGEALASVCAVSRTEIMTKQKYDELGTHYIIEGSEEVLYEKTGCPDGTTIIIRDLFYNVPARQKFLKKDVTEGNAVCSIVNKIALSHPEVAFRFIRDNKNEFSTAGDGRLYSSIFAVYGKTFATDMVEVNYEQDGIKVKGYTVKPLYSKANRTYQNFFVNDRYVKSQVCASAVEEAYNGVIMVGKFPACVLKIEISPDIVDVNVHPAKVEIKFSDDKPIYDCLYFAIKSALMKSGLVYDFQIKQSSVQINENENEKYEQPSLPLEVKDSAEPQKEITTPVTRMYNLPDGSEVTSKVDKETGEIVDCSSKYKFITPEALKRKEPVLEKKEEKKPEPEPKPELKYIGEAFNGYIIAEAGEKIIIIDKHAAHERIIFEKLRSEDRDPASQLVMFSEGILLSMEEIDSLQENTDFLENIGFKLDFSKSPYVNVKSVPTIISHLNMDEIIPEIADNLRKNKKDPKPEAIDDILHTIACKAAIKIHDKNSDEELKKLALDVYYNEKIRHCPHGRPVMFVISKYDLEKQFRRIL